MRGHQEVTFTLNLGIRSSENAHTRSENNAKESHDGIPRIARLMALSIRLEGLIHDGTLHDYADVAQRGQVTRARITQIMKLLNLAPDIQERIVFLTADQQLNERKLRPVTAKLEWEEQRRLFQELTCSAHKSRGKA
jgi:hypothetical protein